MGRTCKLHTEKPYLTIFLYLANHCIIVPSLQKMCIIYYGVYITTVYRVVFLIGYS